MRLEHLQIQLQLPEKDIPSPWWAYALYGALMEQIDPSYGEILHQQTMTPIKQYLQCQPHQPTAIWHVTLMGQQTIDHILPLLIQQQQWQLHQYNSTLTVTEIQRKQIDIHQLCSDTLTKVGHRKVRYQLITPCSFKSQEQYQFMPQKEYVIKSMVQAWQYWGEEVAIQSQETVDHLIEYTHLYQYQIKSKPYYLKGKKIPAFVGTLDYQIRGPQAMVRLFNLLALHSHYTGIGMKTTLGMGGCRISLLS